MKTLTRYHAAPHMQRPVFLLVLTGLLAVMSISACSVLRVPEPEPEQKITESGLAYTIIRQGDGHKPQEGDFVSVHYTGMLSDGSVFDSSYEREEPVQFRMGSGEVLPGWEEGIALLKEGTKATIVIPPELAYGDLGFGPIPEDETLSFEVELLSVYSPDISPEAKEIYRNETSSGIQYTVIEAGEGIGLSEEMYVSLNYTGYIDDAGQSLFDSSYEREEPFGFILGRKMVIPGWEEALPELNVGDVVRMWIPYQMAYGKQGRGPIPPKANLVFDIEILDAQPVDSPEKFPTQGKDTLETDTGLRYILVKEGVGDPPAMGSVLKVHYSGYLSDGRLFDSSVQRSEPFRFVLGTGQVLKGWDEAFALFSKGTKARIIVPPHLAYGKKGKDPIPPRETLIFDVELIDILR